MASGRGGVAGEKQCMATGVARDLQSLEISDDGDKLYSASRFCDVKHRALSAWRSKFAIAFTAI
jgi:hypothetical protein